MPCATPAVDAVDADQLLVDAQDAYFEGRLAEAVALCTRVVEANTSDGEAYSLLFLSLFQLERYEDALERCRGWAVSCALTPTLAEGALTAAYMLGRKQEAREWADRLAATCASELTRATAAAMLADMHVDAEAVALDQEEPLDDGEDSTRLRVEILRAWASLRQCGTPRDLDRLWALAEVPADTETGEAPELLAANAAFAIALLAVAQHEANDAAGAERALAAAREHTTWARDPNLAAAAWLVRGRSEAKPTSYRQANALLQKRIWSAQ